MDIKRMHCMIEKLTECAEQELAKGVECVDTAEMGAVIDMIKDISEAMYHRTLQKTMEESDTEDIMDMFDRYEDGGRMYYDHYRYEDGRFAPKGKGRYRRGYVEPPYYRMTPEMYHDMEDYRDYDRKDGRMYYTEPATVMKSESNYDRAKRAYTESRDLHRGNTAQDKEAKMKDLEGYFREISTDITDLLADMTQEERSMLKAKVSALATKL